jgi:hypothetical protein
MGNNPSASKSGARKKPLSGVFEGTCRQFDVPLFACRGYVSLSEMWSAAQRLRQYEAAGQQTIILYLGDHDPSGLDMVRDVRERLALFESAVKVENIALTYEATSKPKKFAMARSCPRTRQRLPRSDSQPTNDATVPSPGSWTPSSLRYCQAW